MNKYVLDYSYFKAGKGFDEGQWMNNSFEFEAIDGNQAIQKAKSMLKSHGIDEPLIPEVIRRHRISLKMISYTSIDMTDK